MSETSYASATAISLDQIEAIADELENAAPQTVLAWAFGEFGNRVAIATGFGAEGVALIDMAAKINPRPDVFFIDTDFLFRETYELRRRLEQRYGLEIRAIRTDLTPADQQEIYGAELWARDPDLCCRLRKVEPLRVALEGLDAWITAIRRNQTDARRNARIVEWDFSSGRVKINPLATWSRQQVWDYIRANQVPYNPLHERGYPSLGCTHCTRAVREGEDERAGRWPGKAKTECGLHLGSGQWSVAGGQSADNQSVSRDEFTMESSPDKQSLTTDHRPLTTVSDPRPLTLAQGAVIWLTGLSGAGKTTLARSLSRSLIESGLRVETLDGDEVRENLSRGLGFSRHDRDVNVGRIGFVARLLARNGVIVLAAAISPYRQSRDDARRAIENEGLRFIEVYVRCPLGVLISRDVKGLYRKALAGEIKSFTGVSDIYEPPLSPDLIVDSSMESIEESAARILSLLSEIDLVAGNAPVTAEPVQATGD